MLASLPTGAQVYVSAATAGTVAGIAFADEDILRYEADTNKWSLYFDGSDVGLSSVNVDAFHIPGDAQNSILLSVNKWVVLAGVGLVKKGDIVKFTPTSLGTNTAGTFSWFLEGADVGLNGSADIDGIAFTHQQAGLGFPDNKLIVSLATMTTVGGKSYRDEDLIVFNGTPNGKTTANSGWKLYLDGSDVGLDSPSISPGVEDTRGVWVDPNSGKIYLSTAGNYQVPGASGTGSDIFSFTPQALGNTTAGTFQNAWDGSDAGFGTYKLDGISLRLNQPPTLANIETTALNFTENQPPAQITSTITVADPEANAIASATIQITGNYQPGFDTLSVTGLPGGITGVFNAASGKLTISGSASAADYETYLRAVKFQCNGDNPSTLERTVRFTVTDVIGAASLPTTRAINVVAVNDSPAILTNTTLTVAEGANATISSAHLNENDPDDSGAGLTYTITSGPTNGRVELSSNPGVAISSFTQAQINANVVRYVHDGSETSSDSFGFSLADGGENGATPATGTFNITVTPVNDPPVPNDDSESTTEDTSLTVNETNGVRTNDTDTEGDALTVTAGTFTTTQGGLLLLAADGSYVYTPPSNFSGQDTYVYTVTDANCGSDTGTLTITVSPVTDGANVRTGAGPVQRTIGPEFDPFDPMDPNKRVDDGNRDETDARTAALSDGGFVMVWTQNTGTPQILAQRFGANGDPEGSVIVVTALTAPNENEPDVTALPGGGFAVAWVASPGADGATDIQVAVYGNAGITPTASFTVVSSVAGTEERNPTITALADGNLLVTWAVPTGSGMAPSHLFAQRFTVAGAEVDADPISVSTTAAHATPPPTGVSAELYPGDPAAQQSVAALAGGAFAIAWVESGSDGEIHVQTFGADGAPGSVVILDVGSGASTANYIDDTEPDIALLTSGKFVVTWSSSGANGGTSDIFAQLFNADGTTSGSVTPLVVVGGPDVPSPGADYSEFSPSVTALPGGRFALCWTRPVISSNNGDVFTQVFNDGLTPSGDELRLTVNSQTIPNRDPIVTALSDGRYVLSWIEPKAGFVGSDLVPVNTGTQDDILYQIFEPGAGGPLEVVEGETITLPTTITLFDADGSEQLQRVSVWFSRNSENFEFSYTLQGGHEDVSFEYAPPVAFDPGWVIDRDFSSDEAALLDAIVAGTASLVLEPVAGQPASDFVVYVSAETIELATGIPRQSVFLTIPITVGV